MLLECYYRGRPVAEAARRLGVPRGHREVAHALRAAGAASSRSRRWGWPHEHSDELPPRARRRGLRPRCPQPRRAARRSSGTSHGCDECTRSVARARRAARAAGPRRRRACSRTRLPTSRSRRRCCPRCSAEVRRRRRRRDAGHGAGWPRRAAAVAVVVPLAIAPARRRAPRTSPPPAPSRPTPATGGDARDGPGRRRPGRRPRSSLEQVTWGTRLRADLHLRHGRWST